MKPPWGPFRGALESTIRDAKLRDPRDSIPAARRLCAWAAELLEANEPLPPPLRDYFAQALSSIAAGADSQEQLNLTANTRGRKKLAHRTKERVWMRIKIERLQNPALSLRAAAERVRTASPKLQHLTARTLENYYREFERNGW